MKAIMAMSANRCIGKNGKLPWPNIPEDFKHFKALTMHKIILVGRKTFEGLPPLKNRDIWVISNNISDTKITNTLGAVGKVYNLEFVSKCPIEVLNDIWICGGKSIYEFFMPYIKEFQVTHINAEYDGDCFMLEFEYKFKKDTITTFEWGNITRYIK